jgi:hypothetical protein
MEERWLAEDAPGGDFYERSFACDDPDQEMSSDGSQHMYASEGESISPHSFLSGSATNSDSCTDEERDMGAESRVSCGTVAGLPVIDEYNWAVRSAHEANSKRPRAEEYRFETETRNHTHSVPVKLECTVPFEAPQIQMPSNQVPLPAHMPPNARAHSSAQPDQEKKPDDSGMLTFEAARRKLLMPEGISPRPHRMHEVVRDAALAQNGALFIDDGARRKHKGDRWKMMGGAHSSSTSQEHGVCRSYGSVKLHGSDMKARFHCFTLTATDSEPSAGMKLWHVLPAQEFLPSSAATPRAHGGNAPTPPGSSELSEGAVYHLQQGVLPQPLRSIVRKADWDPAYVDFEDHNGEWQGSIAQGAAGAAFQSRSGDFAEVSAVFSLSSSVTLQVHALTVRGVTVCSGFGDGLMKYRFRLVTLLASMKKAC